MRLTKALLFVLAAFLFALELAVACPPSEDAAHEMKSSASWDFFTNHGNYMQRIHCLRTESGAPDWPWIGILLATSSAIIAGYLKVFVFWRKCYRSESPDDRDDKLWSLALVFLICGICGYGMSIVIFFWPAYRLLALMLIGLAFATWRFAWNLKPFELAFAARRAMRKEREAAQIANTAKTEFLANMSHEIRTPMTAILGYTDFLLGQDEPADLPKDRLQALRTIQRNGKHLLAIINDVLDMSKIEAGKMSVEHVPTNPAEIAEEAVSLLRERASGKGLALDVFYDSRFPETIQSDPTRLRQILLNLVGNAIKFTEVGGVSIRIDYDATAASMRFHVVDTGIGMTPEQRDAISQFDAFAQADTSTTRKFGGSGLGLSISNVLAEFLGGGIEIESSFGRGSVFTVTIATGDVAGAALITPAAARAARASMEGAQAASNNSCPTQSLRGLRLLLAEDGPDNQRLISFVLKKAKADVEVVENGKLAVDAAMQAYDSGHPFNVILMDMQMPELDGYEATKKLRADGYAGPIIALTAHAMDGDRQKCIDAGCNDYETKPIDRASLLKTIQTVADQFSAQEIDSNTACSSP